MSLGPQNPAINLTSVIAPWIVFFCHWFAASTHYMH